MSARYSEPAFGSRPVRQSAPRPQTAATTIGAPGIFCYSIQAQAEPGVMPRVLALFAGATVCRSLALRCWGTPGAIWPSMCRLRV